MPGVESAALTYSLPLSSSSLEEALRSLDRTVPVFNDRTLDRVMREASSRRRIAMVVLAVCGAVAVLLAAIGLYGVIAQGWRSAGRKSACAWRWGRRVSRSSACSCGTRCDPSKTHLASLYEFR